MKSEMKRIKDKIGDSSVLKLLHIADKHPYNFSGKHCPIKCRICVEINGSIDSMTGEEFVDFLNGVASKAEAKGII